MNNSKIIFADDSVEMRDLLMITLSRSYSNIITAGDGTEVLELLEEHDDVVLILTDIEMPEMNGFDLTYNIRNKLLPPKCSIPIIAFTSYDTASPDYYLKAGFDELIVKSPNATPILEVFDKYCNPEFEF